jgi:hypothetical protein
MKTEESATPSTEEVSPQTVKAQDSKHWGDPLAQAFLKALNSQDSEKAKT